MKRDLNKVRLAVQKLYKDTADGKITQLEFEVAVIKFMDDATSDVFDMAYNMGYCDSENDSKFLYKEEFLNE